MTECSFLRNLQHFALGAARAWEVSRAVSTLVWVVQAAVGRPMNCSTAGVRQQATIWQVTSQGLSSLSHGPSSGTDTLRPSFRSVTQALLCCGWLAPTVLSHAAVLCERRHVIYKQALTMKFHNLK